MKVTKKALRTRSQSSLTRQVMVRPAEVAPELCRRERRAQRARIKRWEKKNGPVNALLA